jgi:hypothetical protein
MKRHDHGLRLVSTHPPPAGLFATGDDILESGLYLIYHRQHRVPHEVTLLKGEKFPRCEKCDTAVRFKLLQAAPEISADGHFRVRLYSLPVMEEDSTAQKRSTEERKKAA